jgi:hypothetical protein
MTWIREFFGALYELARLAVVSRFRFRGAYWSWRLHTAFGRGYPKGRTAGRWGERGAIVHSVLDYGRWVYRMRRMR